MKKKPDRVTGKGALRTALKRRLKILENSKQLYEQNPNLLKNVRTANIELIQNEIEFLKKFFPLFN